MKAVQARARNITPTSGMGPSNITNFDITNLSKSFDISDSGSDGKQKTTSQSRNASATRSDQALKIKRYETSNTLQVSKSAYLERGKTLA